MPTSTEPHLWTGLYVPRDVEADLVEALLRFDLDVHTLVPAAVKPGLTRVSRIGGELTESEQRDNPKIMVEVWAKDAVSAFDQAIKVYGAFKAIEYRGWVVEDVPISGLEMQTPRAADDPDAPQFYRVQFIAEYVTTLNEIELQEAPNG